MLSKQEKQRYGEVLRQQMKEKQERKKLQEMQKRGNLRQMQPPKDQQPSYKPTAIEKQNTYQRPFVDPKEELQKKLQTQDYSYFGGMGGGAPNRRPEQNVTNLRNMSQPNNLRMGSEQMMQFSGNMKPYQNEYPVQPQQRVRTVSQQEPYYAGQGMMNPLESISPQSINYPPRQSQAMYYQDGGIPSIPQGRLPNPYQLQVTQNYQPYSNGSISNRDEPRQPISYDLIPETTKQPISRIQQYIPPNQYQPQQSYPTQINQMQPLTLQKPSAFQPAQNIPPPIMDNQMTYQMMEDSTNQELQEVYKKGGRNLLKLENQTIDQHMIKQKRKLEIQKQLKQQIEQAQRRKKQEKQRLKREEQEEERKHLAYLAQQKRKLDEEQRKNRQAKQKIIDDNLRNIQQKKQMEEEAKRKVERERLEKQRRQNENLRLKEQQKRQQQEFQRQKNRKPPQNFSGEESRGVQKPSARITEDDNTSVVSSETSEMQKGFNTAMSKEFFRKERERKNPSTNVNHHYEKVTEEIQKMNYELLQQRKDFQRVIEQKQRAQIEKRRANEEIERLKIELKKKMDEDNDKLLRALQSDYSNKDFNQLPPQHYKNLNEYQAPHTDEYQNQYPTFGKKPMRQREHQNLVQKDYEPQPAKYIPREDETNQFEQSNVGLMSLDGDSKKIPLILEHSQKLTMSQVEDFAKDSAFFQRGLHNGLNNKPSPQKQKFNMRIHESIAEEADEDRDIVNNQSRNSNRNKQTKKESSLYKPQHDELDKLMESRAKSRGGWGEMSSVNSDITKEIDELLRKKENSLGSNNNGRPNSISNAGRQSLSKQGYAYDGLTLNSNVGGTLGTNGTLDLDRIIGRNDARLKELKNLGVQTINTNGDDDLNVLDRIINNYK